MEMDEKTPMNEKKAINVLKEIKTILDKANVTYWLDQGALLGAVREGKFIPWDNDIELGIFFTELDKVVNQIPEMEKRGFKVFVEHRRIVICKDSIDLNIWIKRIKGDQAWQMWYVFPDRKKHIGFRRRIHWYIREFAGRIPYKNLYKKNMKERILFAFIPKFAEKPLCNLLWKLWELMGGEPKIIAVPKFYYENMKKITFYGMEFNIPAKVEDYLSLKYGKDWRTPQKNWVWWRDDGAIVKEI